MLDIIGHIGYLFLMLGQILLTQKSVWGWAARFIGEVTWIVIGFFLGMTSIWSWGILFAIIDLRGFFKWKKERKVDREARC